MKESDIPETAFRNRYVHYKFMVILFGLTNAPLSFMDLMKRFCRPFLERTVIIFIDYILRYLRNQEEHREKLWQILEILWKEKLFAKFSKYEFWLREVQFLGHVISEDRVQVDPMKIKAPMKWDPPKKPIRIS